MGIYSEEYFIVVSVKLIVLLTYTLGRDRNHHSSMKFFEPDHAKATKINMRQDIKGRKQEVAYTKR